jgi:predicted nucleic acid-binding protein
LTHYLLDTNIISEAIKPEPSAALLDWLGEQPSSDLFIATFTLAEVRRGILAKPSGRKRRELEAWFSGPEGPLALFEGRILAFDEAAAEEWARIMAEGTAAGRPRSALDMIVAATAAANRCIVATLNDRHFRGIVDCVNPLQATS